MPRPVLGITGGTGFVGRTLIATARAAGHKVHALTRRPQPKARGLRWIEGALDQPYSLAQLAEGVDAIIHVAGVVNAPDRAGFRAGNIDGTLAMVEAAKAAGVRRFVHVSSLSAREPGLSNYGWSKARAEQVVAASGLDWTSVRPPAVYGPGDYEMLELFRMAKRGLVLLPPEGRLSVIEVSDLARLLLALVPAEETLAETFEPDDGVEGGWRHRDFGRAIGAAVGRRVVTLSAPRPMLALASRADRMLRKGKAKLTSDRVNYFCHPDWVSTADKKPPRWLWVPKVETRAGLARTAAWYRGEGVL